jgi:hypothetical protein
MDSYGLNSHTMAKPSLLTPWRELLGTDHNHHISTSHHFSPRTKINSADTVPSPFHQLIIKKKMKFSTITTLCAVAPSFTNAQDGSFRLRNSRMSSVAESSNCQAAALEDSPEEELFWQERELEMSMSMSMEIDFVCEDSEARRARIIEIIGDISGDSIAIAGTPQNDALLFVLDEDDGRVCPDDPVCGEIKVINRYQMAFLYFSTDGDEWSNCAADDTDSECITGGQTGDGDNGNLPACLDGSSARWLSSESEFNWCDLSCNNVDTLSPTTDGCRTADIQLGKSHPVCLSCSFQ